MKISYYHLAREEHVSDPFALPWGRRVVAQLEVASVVAAGSQPAEPDTMQLVIESRASQEEPFTELARTRAIAGAGTVSVELPMFEQPAVDPAAATAAGRFGSLPPAPPTARVRLIHTGSLLPRVEVHMVGL